MDELIDAEVAYALPDKQAIVPLKVAPDCTVLDAVQQSGIEQLFPGLVLEGAKLGIFGQAVSKPHERVLRAGERVEIYRPLLIDPKEARKAVAAKLKAEKK
jgi:putative ubiquitin-RnfH superfamily antitoxin RatB of RatAB toxin-antitoxin module